MKHNFKTILECRNYFAMKCEVEKCKKELREKLKPRRHITGEGDLSDSKSFFPYVKIKEILGE